VHLLVIVQNKKKLIKMWIVIFWPEVFSISINSSNGMP